MDRRAFLALIATAPIAAQLWPNVSQATTPDLEWPSMEPFVTLPTDSPIVQLAEFNGFLCALTADGTCWVIDRNGEIVTRFT